MIVTSYFTRANWSRSTNRVVGQIIGYLPDGRDIASTPIVSIVGRTVTTRGGTVYTLSGPPRWPDQYPDGTDESPLGSGDPEHPFCLWETGEPWPAGATVPATMEW